MAHGTREKPRERDHAFWNTHFRQRGYRRPGQQQQYHQNHPGFHHGSGGNISQNNCTNPSNNNYSDIALSSLVYHPRPFDHTESERQHLEYLLAEQDRRAIYLFSQIAALDKAQAFGSAREQRHARKDRAWLLRRIDETVGRERKILARLGEIYVEIQCRGRWNMVEQQKASLWQQHGDWGFGWGGEGDVSNRQRQQSRCASPRHHQDHIGPAIVSSCAQQQHVWSADPQCPSTAVAPWTDRTRWYEDFATPAAVDRRRHRASGGETGGQAQPFEENPAYRLRRYSDISNASSVREVDVEHVTTSRNPVLPVSRLPDRRRSLPTMHYNWERGDSGH